MMDQDGNLPDSAFRDLQPAVLLPLTVLKDHRAYSRSIVLYS